MSLPALSMFAISSSGRHCLTFAVFFSHSFQTYAKHAVILLRKILMFKHSFLTLRGQIVLSDLTANNTYSEFLICIFVIISYQFIQFS